MVFNKIQLRSLLILISITFTFTYKTKECGTSKIHKNKINVVTMGRMFDVHKESITYHDQF